MFKTSHYFVDENRLAFYDLFESPTWTVADHIEINRFAETFQKKN
jgi:hypothetical protein